MREDSGESLATSFAGMLGKPVASVHPAGGGGRNSRVYQVTCQGSERYIAKVYPAAGPGQRDRLETEFGCLSFLWENGLRCIPKPIAADREAGKAIYEYIEGLNLVSSEISASDAGQAVAFLLRLKDLRSAEGTADIGPAAEACFSVQEILDNINQRLDRLLSLDEPGPQYRDLGRFLETQLQPALADVRHRAERELGTSISLEISREERTLSPSDFGFHNALRRPNGELVFLDFEYFGWDDPAKMIADFLLHPAMEIGSSLRATFLTGVLDGFEDYPALDDRVRLVFPLFALKWCLILLNEFVPERLARRSFDGGEQADPSMIQVQQLDKARVMLAKASPDYEYAN